MVTKRLLLKIVSEIRKIMKERNLSSRQLENMCKSKGFLKVTRSKIIRAFYVEEGRQHFLNNTDDTIEAVLTALNLTGDDILEKILKEEDNIDTSSCETELSGEIMRFIKSKEAIPYLKLAFIQYKSNQMKKEVEFMKEQIDNL